MKTLLLTSVCGLLGFPMVFATVNAGDSKDQKKEEKKVGALPPHPLDSAFENAKTARAIDEGLLNNPLFKKAVAEALKAKQEQEAKFKENPKLRDASPAQRARLKFLEVLNGEKKAGE
jgi:outer membrane protein TolC